MMILQDDISIVLGGAAGTGIQTIEALLMHALKSEGYRAFASKEYMSRIRGGSNSTEIRITSKRVDAYTRRIDILLPLDEASFRHLAPRVTAETLVAADTTAFKTAPTVGKLLAMPLASMAKECGHPLCANTIATGFVLGLLRTEKTSLRATVERVFAHKDATTVQRNIAAAEAGYRLGEHAAFLHDADIRATKEAGIRDAGLLSGTEAIGMGALAGGCNLVASYPMSPGTGVLTFLAQYAREFGLALEQVEDELAAINMAIGAGYAGARALVTTSGGGFALMTEGVSLSGMIETPVVIHIGMRPGPATGLPTRTAQEDLNLALYAGHGEFPRAILAPGDAAEAFETAQQAFHLADVSQGPVFLLTDQYLLDAVTAVSREELPRLPIVSTVIETDETYRRYQLTQNGVSPRGIPGYGKGLVSVDSDEHTEGGHITEDADIRVAMQTKRLKKHALLQEACLKPVLGGVEKSATLLVGWGSTKKSIAEAAEKLGFAALHFKQVWPLPENVAKLFVSYEKIVVIENNASGQFAELLRREDVNVTETLLKSNGEPFDAEEIVGKRMSLELFSKSSFFHDNEVY
jgi:2-oxoglutarate ferredoxin oxidoreductase subunit alpha